MTERPKRDCLSRVAGRQLLIRVLAAAGAGSRSQCAGMVRGGRVAVNGRLVRNPQSRADPFRELVTLDGQAVQADTQIKEGRLTVTFPRTVTVGEGQTLSVGIV